MSLIRPFRGLRPNNENAVAVAAPPYDVLNTEEARLQAADKPWSFLHISKPEIDLPPGTDPFAAEVYAQGKTNFDRMLTAGILQQDPTPYYYLYRLVMAEHSQIGLVAAASVADYDSNRIRKHEFTQPDKEDDRVRQIDGLNALTGPVFLTYRHNAVIDRLVAEITQPAPQVDITADNGVRHSLWLVRDSKPLKIITDTFNAMDYLYIADGHHRSAAASRVAKARQQANPQHIGEEAYNYFLTVIFPDNQMQILDYNRVLTDLNGLKPATFLQAIGRTFTVSRESAAYKPQKPGQFAMYLQQQWYCLTIKPERIPQHDPVARLDISLLTDHLIGPILNVTDPRRDKRIDFIGGIRGLQELERRVDSGEMAVAFALFPTSMAELMAVADANEVMPPKSTWFEPKLADGLVTHMLD